MSRYEPKWTDYEKANPIRVSKQLDNPHPITRMTAAVKGWEIPDAFDANQLTRPEWFDVSIHQADPNRILRLIDALLKACEARGFELRHMREGGGISVIVEGESFGMSLTEGGKPISRLTLEAGWQKWNDTLSRPLEGRLNNVMLVLRSAAAWRISSRQREEKHAAMERRRAELREEVAQERADVDELFAHAEKWHRAQILRGYIAVIKAQPVKRKKTKRRANWVAWAYEQADRIDPTMDSPPSVLDIPKSQYRELRLEEILNDDGEIEWA